MIEPVHWEHVNRLRRKGKIETNDTETPMETLTSSGTEGAFEGIDEGKADGNEVIDGLVESEGELELVGSSKIGDGCEVGEFTVFPVKYAVADLLTQLRSSLGRNGASDEIQDE